MCSTCAQRCAQRCAHHVLNMCSPCAQRCAQHVLNMCSKMCLEICSNICSYMGTPYVQRCALTSGLHVLSMSLSVVTMLNHVLNIALIHALILVLEFWHALEFVPGVVGVLIAQRTGRLHELESNRIVLCKQHLFLFRILVPQLVAIDYHRCRSYWFEYTQYKSSPSLCVCAPKIRVNDPSLK